MKVELDQRGLVAVWSSGGGGGGVTVIGRGARCASATGAMAMSKKLPMTIAERSRVIFMAVGRVTPLKRGARAFSILYATFL
jgi:hypothetical protein